MLLLNTATAHRNHYREAFSRLHGISPSQAREKGGRSGHFHVYPFIFK
ncbi:hypothetical protein CHCC20441_0504 [Bacillus licheniformis]|nr:hypothetical protein B4092_0603 [Bacillus licheniformis]KYC96767.1 hypothetical protein B4164_0509 [Bacillus licheniformis]OLF99363.1 hypothetical protein B4089_0103 [Bacillus licheniformis]OLG05463.1 hypothetical protein B4124_1553 [Bacillus licheniformis]TWJ41355.1 hypothetical protein CHCC5025_3690 [Bacillus licheniformis]